MGTIDFIAINKLILEQEERLQFEHFNSRDAWDIGKMMVEEIFTSGIELSVCIRQLNGNIMFQYATEKTSLNNQNWMIRKFNMVSLMQRSSLGATAVSHITNEGLLVHGLSNEDYVFCGGGFPVRIKGSGICAVITVSNLPHVQDHNFIVKCLCKYLSVDLPLVNDDF